MSSNKKKLLKTILINNAGCGCGRPKPSDVHQPSSSQLLTKAQLISTVSRKAPNPSSSSSSSSSNSNQKEDCISTSTVVSSNTTSLSSEPYTALACSVNGGQGQDHLKSTSKIIDSIAVVKDSSDPYQDFKTSMLQMILEKEMYSENDLQELLNCFLELNSAYHHGVIIQVFTEIWNEVIVFKRLIIKSQKPCCSSVEQGRRSSVT